MQRGLHSTLLLLQICGGQASCAIFFISALMTGRFGEYIEGQLLTFCSIQKSFIHGHNRSRHTSVSILGMIAKLLCLLETRLHLHSNTHITLSKTVSLVTRGLHERSNSESSPLLMLVMRSITRLKQSFACVPPQAEGNGQLFAVNKFSSHMPSIAIDFFGASLNWLAESRSLDPLDMKKVRDRWVCMASGAHTT